jgi:hypothetical protein
LGKADINLFLEKLGSPRQPQERTTDCDKQKNSQDTTTEEQIHAFLSHANYNGPKRRWFINMATRREFDRGNCAFIAVPTMTK